MLIFPSLQEVCNILVTVRIITIISCVNVMLITIKRYPASKLVQKLLFEWFSLRLRYAKSEENRRGEYVRFHVACGEVK